MFGCDGTAPSMNDLGILHLPATSGRSKLLSFVRKEKGGGDELNQQGGEQ